MYRVFLERAAERDLKKLSVRVHDRVISAIQRLAENPRPAGCRKLTGGDKDRRSEIPNVSDLDLRIDFKRAPVFSTYPNQSLHRLNQFL
jgi:hypothetical protein